MTNKELQLFIYQCQNGSNVELKCFDENTLWATQQQIATIFDCSVNNVSDHISNIYSIGECNKNDTFRIFRNVSNQPVFHYNLDMIIAVGYRVNSTKATQFRIWATKILREYLIKGFALDDDRFKNGNKFDREYFKELLERVKSIRASERQIWMQITDIFAEVAVDYDSKSITTRQFFSMIQNKFHYAITNSTAAEIVYNSADHEKEHMGLATWKNAPDGRILKSDVSIAKNYLDEKQIRQLERAVTGYFDYIEDLIERENVFTMEEFENSVNAFLEFRQYKVLKDNGKITHKQALDKAHKEYEIFNKTQPIESDFDREVKKMIDNKKRG